MNNQTKAAMQMALEALEQRENLSPKLYDYVTTALREALQEHALQTLSDIHQQIEQPQGDWVDWRELCRRLYVELFYCDQQMTHTNDEDGEPMWITGATVRDALADAKEALQNTPPVVPQGENNE